LSVIVPDDGYFRNALCAINKISTFLLYWNVSKDLYSIAPSIILICYSVSNVIVRYINIFVHVILWNITISKWKKNGISHAEATFISLRDVTVQTPHTGVHNKYVIPYQAW